MIHSFVFPLLYSSQRDACLSVLFVVGDKMGGCCSSSSRHSHLVGAPLYYYVSFYFFL